MITGEKARPLDRVNIPPTVPEDGSTPTDVKLISAATKVLLRVSGAAENLFAEEGKHSN